MRSRVARIVSSTCLASIRNFLLPCSTSHGSLIKFPKIRRNIAYIQASTSAIYSTNPITSSSLLLSVKYSSSSSSESNSLNSSNEVSDMLYATIVSNASSDQRLESSLNSMSFDLTTDLVNAVIRKLRYDEKLALRFFTWAGYQDGYFHEHQTFNDMIEILSSTGFKTKQFGVLCDLLDYMKRNTNKSISAEALISIMKSYAERHLTSIGKFAKKKRFKPKIQPEIYSLNLLLDSLCKCSLTVEAEAIFRRVERNLVPTGETFNILFFGWCRLLDPKKAMRVLEEMIKRGHNPESFTYNAAITSFCDAGMIAEARELFEFMRTRGSPISSPTAKTYSVMIIALAKHDMMDECFDLFHKMRDSGCLPDVSTYVDLIEGMCAVGRIESAYKVMKEMGEKGFPPDILTYNCFLKVLCNMKEHKEALGLCEKMIEEGCEPSVHTYNMMLSLFFEIGDSIKASGIWDEMEKRGCLRSPDSYGVMINGLFGCGKAEDACALLDEVIDRGIKLPYKKYDALMSRLSEIGNLRAIHRLSEHMRRFYNVAMARRFSMSQKKRSMSLKR